MGLCFATLPDPCSAGQERVPPTHSIVVFMHVAVLKWDIVDDKREWDPITS
jgi:hypothetical protein